MLESMSNIGKVKGNEENKQGIVNARIRKLPKKVLAE